MTSSVFHVPIYRCLLITGFRRRSARFMLLSQLCLATAIPHSTPVESPENLVRNVPENKAGLESRAFDFLRDVMDEDIEAD